MSFRLLHDFALSTLRIKILPNSPLKYFILFISRSLPLLSPFSRTCCTFIAISSLNSFIRSQGFYTHTAWHGLSIVTYHVTSYLSVCSRNSASSARRRRPSKFIKVIVSWQRERMTVCVERVETLCPFAHTTTTWPHHAAKYSRDCQRAHRWQFRGRGASSGWTTARHHQDARPNCPQFGFILLCGRLTTSPCMNRTTEGMFVSAILTLFLLGSLTMPQRKDPWISWVRRCVKRAFWHSTKVRPSLHRHPSASPDRALFQGWPAPYWGSPVSIRCSSPRTASRSASSHRLDNSR